MSINITKFLPIVCMHHREPARIRRNREAHPSDISCYEFKLYKPCTQAPIYNAPRNDRDSNRKLESPGVHRRDRPLYFRCGKVACWQRRLCTVGPPSTPVLAPRNRRRLLAKILSWGKILSAIISHGQKNVLFAFVIASSHNFKTYLPYAKSLNLSSI